MPAATPDRILRLIRVQHGVVTRKQLYERGVAPTTLDRRIRQRQWIVAGGGVLVAPGTPESLATWSRIVGLRVPSGILTGPSVAAIRGGTVWEDINLGSLPWLIHPQRSARARYLSHPGVPHTREGPWRLATTAAAVLDTIRLCDHDTAMSLAYRAVQRKVLTVDQLEEAYRKFRRHSGRQQLRLAIREVTAGTRSEGERRLRRLAEQTGVTGWVASYPVVLAGVRYELDLALPARMLYLELDGYAYHSSRGQFIRDRQRANALQNAGWSGLRFSWYDVTRNSGRVIQTIRAALTRIGRLTGTPAA